MRARVHLCARPGDTPGRGRRLCRWWGGWQGRPGQAVPRRQKLMGRVDGWGAGWLEGWRTGCRTSLGIPTGRPSLTSSSLALCRPPLGALWRPTQLPALHHTQLAGLHHDRGQPLAQPRALLPGTHHSLQGGWAGGQSNSRPELPTACHACPALSMGSPRGSRPSPSHPWSWGAQRQGHTDPTWARPLGPFHRRACCVKGQVHTVSKLRAFAPSRQAASHIPPGPFLGSLLQALGLLPAQGSWDAVAMAT